MSDNPAASSVQPAPAQARAARLPAAVRAALVIALYFAVLAYPPLRLADWLSPEWSWQTLPLALVFSAPAIGYVLGKPAHDRTRRWLLRAVYFWLGVCFLLFVLVVAGELALALAPLPTQPLGIVVLVLLALLLARGVVNAERVYVRRLGLTTDKLRAPLRLVQVSDLHIGSRAPAFLRRVVARVNGLQPDLVLITGDLVDMHGITDADLAPLAGLTAPAFFCIGNHERYVGCDPVCARIAAQRVTVLRDAAVVHGSLQIIGIDDDPARDTVADRLARLALDAGRLRVLLYHRPDGLEDASAHGIDLMLCGHTHNGQIVPFNWVVRHQFVRMCGCFRHGATTLYVSPGTGTWGPLLRLGSRNEITEIVLQPE